MSESSIKIVKQDPLGYINIRGDSGDPQFLKAAESVLGQALALSPNSVVLAEPRIYCLGPDEWLVVCAMSDTASLFSSLKSSCSGQHVAVNDLSGAYSSWRLSGDAVPAMLARGSTLDLDPTTFTAGMSAQCGLAKASAIIACLLDNANYEVIVRRSFGRYMHKWLQHVAK